MLALLLLVPAMGLLLVAAVRQEQRLEASLGDVRVPRPDARGRRVPGQRKV